MSSKELYEMFPIGCQNAIPAKKMMLKTGHTHIRRFYEDVEKARKAHFVILANRNGFYRPSQATEIRDYEKFLCRRMMSEFGVLKAIRQELNKMPGQLELELKELLNEENEV